jgi:CRISPR-associated protein Csb3
MRGATARAASAKSPLDCCEAVYDVKDGKARDKTISPFYFDSRRSGTSQDFGFAPDEQEMSVDAFPAVESLALIGLQRFRPRLDRETRPRTFVYSAWAEFLSAPVAAATVGGAVRVRSQGDFRFRRPSRGGEYVTMFSRATREKEQ